MLPQQAVSNRSILRVQQLSNELVADLNTLPIFASSPIASVLFAAVDQFNTNADCRWYNFRLCGSYRFPSEVEKWLKHDRNRVAKEFKPLFEAAREKDRTTRASFQRFNDAIFGEPANWVLAYDQLIIALAVIPYRGVLLSLFEKALGLTSKQQPKNTEKSEPVRGGQTTLCCRFSGPLDQMAIHSFDNFASDGEHLFTEEQEGFSVMADCRDGFRILLPFTRGEKPLTVPDFRPENVSPYPSEPGFNEAKTGQQTGEVAKLSGFVVPAFDGYDRQNNRWIGGFAGWMVAVFLTPSSPSSVEQKDRDYSWLAFTHLMRTYVRRVREAQMFDLVEEYAERPSQPPPESFFREHIRHLTGWKYDNANLQTSLVIPYDPPIQPLSFPVDKLQDTQPANSKPPEDSIRLCKTFLEDLRLVYSERQKGRGAEKRAQYFAASHELKKLASLIPLAKGHDHILDRLPGIFLMFTLPSAGKINELDAQYLPELLWRKQTLKLREWVNDLIRLAAEIEAVVKPGQLGGMLTNRADFDAVVEKFISKFHLDATFDSCGIQVPTHFPARCLYGVGLLCLLRNILQHAFKYDNAAPSGNPWVEAYREQVIVSVGALSESVTFTNPASANTRNGNGGTNDAATFYFDQLAEVGWHFEASAFFNGFDENAGVYKCRVPLPRKTQHCDD